MGEGQEVCVLEAMKMQNSLVAMRGAKVRIILYHTCFEIVSYTFCHTLQILKRKKCNMHKHAFSKKHVKRMLNAWLTHKLSDACLTYIINVCFMYVN